MPVPLIVAIRGQTPWLHADAWLSDAEVAANRHNAEVYQRLLDLHRAATSPTEAD